MRIIDLTTWFEPDFTEPENPFHIPHLCQRRGRTYERDGYQMTVYSLTTHAGTHMDFPAHRFTREQKPTGIYYPEDVPLEWFYGPDNTVVLDCPKGELEPIGAADFENAKVEIREGDIVLVCTGWGRYLEEEPKNAEYLMFKKPGLVEDGAEWLVKRRVRAYGSDVIGTQHPKYPMLPSVEERIKGIYQKIEPVHNTLLFNDILLIEKLVNLDKVANRRITAGFFPMAFKSIDGIQIRALAFLDD